MLHYKYQQRTKEFLPSILNKQTPNKPTRLLPQSPYLPYFLGTIPFIGTTQHATHEIMIGANNIRHRTAAKHGGNTSIRILGDSNPKGGHSTWQNKKFHAGVWARISTIITLFSILALLISRIEKSKDPAHNKSVRAGGTKRISGGGEVSFVTIVMPR